jgi:hypothetical protein
MYRLRPGAPTLRFGIALACALLVLTACGGPAAQSVPTPAGGGLLADLPHLPGSPTATASTTAVKPKSTIPVKHLSTPTPTKKPAPAPPPATSLTKIGGCQIFPPNNPWNANVSNLRVNPNSAEYIASIDLTKQFLHPDFGSNPTYGIPYTVVNKSQPFVPITITPYASESNPGPYPIPLNAPVESGSDRHVIVIDTGNCHLYEMYDARQVGTGWTCASGAVLNLNSNALRPTGWTSADAAGLPILPGIALYSEVSSGVINHALRFTVDESEDGFISPATHEAGSTSNPAFPPMGLRLRLKASFSLAGFHGEALVILTALKKYGMIVADNGSSWYISGDTDPRWNDNDLDQLKSVPGNTFEAVETGPIQH